MFNALEVTQKNGELILLPADTQHRGDHHFTTPALLNSERSLLQMINHTHFSQQPLVTPETLNHFLHEHADLTKEQQQAIKTLFSSDKMLMVLNGSTGSGKTHLLSSMMTLAKIAGYQPIVLTHRQTETLDLKVQLQKTPANLREWLKQCFDKQQIETVYGFLKRQEKMNAVERWLQTKPLLFVENATQLSSQQLNALVNQVERLNGRLILIGDSKSVITWRAGTPFIQLLSHGVLAAHLTQNHRQTPEYLKSALQDSLQQNIAAAMDKIDHRILAIEDPAQRREAMAAHVAALSQEERAQTVVLAPTAASAQDLNISIREALKQKNIIGGHEQSIMVLLPHYFRLAEQQQAHHYQAGQWILFIKNTDLSKFNKVTTAKFRRWINKTMS